MVTAVAAFAAVGMAAVMGVPGASASASAPRMPRPATNDSMTTTSLLPAVAPYSNGFEKNVKSWCNVGSPNPPCDGAPGNYGTIGRANSGTSFAAYGTGINAEAGSWYASVSGAGVTPSGCPTYPASDESCAGPFTTWAKVAPNYEVFPKPLGFTTSLDIYVDTAWASANPNNEFEWDTAMQGSSTNDSCAPSPPPCFLQDYIFTAETQTSPAGFVVGISANTNNDPGSGSGSLGSYVPAVLSQTGWYRFTHRFYKNNSGDLAVEMSITNDTTSTVVADWTVNTAFPISSVGGPAYGWFPNENIQSLPIDNLSLVVN